MKHSAQRWAHSRGSLLPAVMVVPGSKSYGSASIISLFENDYVWGA